jgi:hypothetical protein
VIDVLADYRSFARINRAPYSSTLGGFKINVFTSCRPGTIIVREVLGSAGEVAKLTLMTKGEPGYDPRLGDWWFGVTDPQGVPLTSSGRLSPGPRGSGPRAGAPHPRRHRRPAGGGGGRVLA